MTLEQLRIFVAVAEQEHVTRAAHLLHLTQSATSAAVTALESRYATKLFNRVGRRIELTDAGRLFLVEAKAVLARASAAESVLADLAGMMKGSIRIAASQTVGNYWLPQVIQKFRSLYPGIALKLALGNTEGVAAAVNQGTADLGFIEGEIDDSNIVIRTVAEDRLVLVVGRDHPWSREQPTTPRQFAAASWVCRERGSGTRAALEAALVSLGVDPREISHVLELPSNEAVCAAVEAGAGVTILSSLVVQRALKAGSLRTVDMALPARQFRILHHRERYLTQAAATFETLALGEHGRDM